MILRTERLVLKPFTLAETDLFYRINTSPFVRKYLWDDEEIPRDAAFEILEKNEQLFKKSGYGLWKILYEGQVAGYVGLWFFFHEPQLLYTLREEFSKKGIAYESAKEIIRYAFEDLHFTYLIAATDEPHRESRRLAERLGMKLLEKRVENGKPTVFYLLDSTTSPE